MAVMHENSAQFLSLAIFLGSSSGFKKVGVFIVVPVVRLLM